jgi:hypothetical protein
MLLYYRRRCENGGRHGRWCDNRRGNHDHLRRWRIEGLDDPIDSQVSCDDCEESSNCDRKDLLDVHLSFGATEQSQMQTNPLHMEQDARVDAIYRVIKGNINWDNLVPTLLEAAREVETFPSLKGSEKLDILQKALKHALKESDKSNEEKEKILYYIETVVPIAVQAAVMASKSPLVNAAVAQVEAVCIGCWTKK